MKKNRLLSLALTALLVVGLSTTALAVSKNTSINVAFNDIKLMIDGKIFTPKDAQGNVVEPFSYNGTTYVPIRAVGEAFGKEVSWDSATATVVVGGKSVQNLDEMGAYQFESSMGASKYSSVGEFRTNDYKIARGVKFEHQLENGTDVGAVETTTLSYLLNKEYQTFYAKLDAVDESYMNPTILKIYGDGKLLYTSPTFTKDSKAFDLEVSVANVSVLSFELVSTRSESWSVATRVVLLGDARLVK